MPDPPQAANALTFDEGRLKMADASVLCVCLGIAACAAGDARKPSFRTGSQDSLCVLIDEDDGTVRVSPDRLACPDVGSFLDLAVMDDCRVLTSRAKSDASSDRDPTQLLLFALILFIVQDPGTTSLSPNAAHATR
ncbi:hypothetical protein ISCGN_033021 [Ixodes scapularis]